LIRSIGAEIRLARTGLGLSIAAVASEIGISRAELSRIERAEADWVSIVVATRACAVVGLDLSARAHPGGRPVRDARHARLLETLRKRLHASLQWRVEVPLPQPGDQRAWDATIRGDGWRLGVEAELNPVDGQSLLRRLGLKRRDGIADGVVLLMPDTRQTRLFRREFSAGLETDFPIPARKALDRLAKGLHPGGSSVIIL
jgi:transcriptional regulator with XRE-family HTH domain